MERLQAQTVDHALGLRQAGSSAGIAVRGCNLRGACCELDLRHAVKGTAQAVSQVVGDRVIEHR
ncbi:hypothetical protein D3C79_600810 [compost metagenome]